MACAPTRCYPVRSTVIVGELAVVCCLRDTIMCCLAVAAAMEHVSSFLLSFFPCPAAVYSTVVLQWGGTYLRLPVKQFPIFVVRFQWNNSLQALDLKPNYVRAWTNMGISYANQGKYDESLRYYVRAVAMNPAAENAWQYLRIALSCAGRSDALPMCDVHDVDALQREFPL